MHQKYKKIAGEAIVAGFRKGVELLGIGIVVAIMWAILVLLFSL